LTGTLAKNRLATLREVPDVPGEAAPQESTKEPGLTSTNPADSLEPPAE
jgi:hypothetical protein